MLDRQIRVKCMNHIINEIKKFKCQRVIELSEKIESPSCKMPRHVLLKIPSSVERKRAVRTRDAAMRERRKRDKVVTRPAVGRERVLNRSPSHGVVTSCARQTYLLSHKQCRVPGDSLCRRRVALSEGFNQVVPQALCRNYPAYRFSGDL